MFPKNLIVALLTICSYPVFSQSPAETIREPFDSLWIWNQTEIYFDFGESQINVDADSMLSDLQVRFEHRPDSEYLIQAHTDGIGSDAANLKLSEARAQSVADWLYTLGVDSSQVKLETFGESKPQASNDTDAGRQYNRRATVQIQETRKMVWMKGKVVDLETGVGLPADLIIRYKEGVDSASTNDQGEYEFPVPARTVISIEAFTPGYFFETKMLKTGCKITLGGEIKLPRVKVGEVIQLNHFYFVGNQDVLLPRSEPELYRLLRFMQINPDLTIEIAGHINLPNQPSVSLTTWHYDLSVRRAKRIYQYLVDQGVSENRLGFIGFGNWNMRFPNARTQQEQELNRRVEIRVPGEGEILSRQDSLIPENEFLLKRLEQWRN